jgi:hypothetical protein
MSRKGKRGAVAPQSDDVQEKVEVETTVLTDEELQAFEDKTNTTEICRVHVATPAYDGKVDADYASSMLMAGQLCSLNMVEVSTAILGNGAFIEIARNVLVKEFLEAEELKNFTHFMFIDADLKFEPRAISGLVRSGLPVSAGAYRRRQEVESFPIRWTPMPKRSPKEPSRLWLNNGGWLRTDRVPTGFLCIERGVLEEMTRRAIAGEFPYDKENKSSEYQGVVDLPDKGRTPWLFYTKIDDQGRFTGEDFCWCDDYMALYNAGVFPEPIWVWPDFDFVHGGYDCNYQHYLAREVGKYKPKRRLGGRK